MRLKLTFFIIFIFLGCLIYFSRVNRVVCTYNNFPCPLSLEPVLVSLKNQNIFFLKKSQIKANLFKLDPALTEIKIKREIPGTVFIQLQRRQPIAQLIQSNQYFLLDQEGEIFQLINSSRTNLISIEVDPTVSLTLGKSELGGFLASFILSLKENYLNFSALKLLEHNQVLIKTTIGPEAIINLNKNVESQVGSLQYILSGFKIEDSLPNKIDLRFDQPILIF